MSTNEGDQPPTADDAELLPQQTRDKLVAVVVDANAYGKVGPDMARLADLAADLAKINLRMWVPEPVAWEWAEHLAAEWVTARNLAKKHFSQLSRAGLPALAITPDYRDRDDVVDSFLLTLAQTPHVEVIALSGESAAEGLKDQVLQRPPAKTKTADKVKTGGSDSAWLREVLKQAGAADALLFLSQDADIARAWNTWGHGQPLMRTPATIRSAFFGDVPATATDQWLVARYLAGQLPLDLTGPADNTAGRLVGVTEGLLDALDLDWEEHGWTGGNLTALTALAGLSNVMREAPELHEKGKIPSTRTIRATAFFLADAETTHVFQFEEDDPVSESTASHTGLLARTRLVLRMQDNEIVDVRPDSDTAVFTAGQFDDNWDAIEEVDEAMTSVPGLALPPEWGGWQDTGHEQRLTVASFDYLDITVRWHHSDYGGFTIIIEDEEAEVTCCYNDETWAGGSDGFHMEPPYYITVDTPRLTASGAWILSAWMIDRLLQHTASFANT